MYYINRTAVLFLLLVAAGSYKLAAANELRCHDSQKASNYLSQSVDGITSKQIADLFIAAKVLEGRDRRVSQFWIETGNQGGDIASLVKQWRASEADRDAVLKSIAFVEMLQELQKTIIAFENARESPERAAEIIAGDWDDWRSKHMSREEFLQQFMAEVSARKNVGLTTYAATLQAAHATRNRLDDLNNAAGRRTPPHARHEMEMWDSYLRQQAVSAKVDELKKDPDGWAYWRVYLIWRLATIKCVAMDMQSVHFLPKLPRNPGSQEPAEIMKALVSDIRRSRFSEREGKFQKISIEFWSRFNLIAYVKSDESFCGINFFFFDAQDGTPVKFGDNGCNGTLDSLQVWGDLDSVYRDFTPGQLEYYEWLLPIAGKLVAAVADYESYNPKPERALSPDPKFVRMNREALQRIIDATALSQLGGDRNRSDFPGDGKIFMKIFFGGGWEVSFSAEVDPSGYSTKCFAVFEEPNAKYTIFDGGCDGTFEAGDFGKGMQRLDSASMVKVINGMLRDIDRFAVIGLDEFKDYE